MVRSPVTAEPWQPLSFVRQLMLTNSFSILPVLMPDGWRVVTDAQVAAYLRAGAGPDDRKRRLGTDADRPTRIKYKKLKID